MLFHVSEERGIEQFEPRASVDGSASAIWAIEAGRLCNYLVPRECPRVTFYAGRQTTDADVRRFLGSSTAVVTIERELLALSMVTAAIDGTSLVPIDRANVSSIVQAATCPIWKADAQRPDIGLDTSRRSPALRWAWSV
jgi:Family of unknown function (DUF6886)